MLSCKLNTEASDSLTKLFNLLYDKNFIGPITIDYLKFFCKITIAEQDHNVLNGEFLSKNKDHDFISDNLNKEQLLNIKEKFITNTNIHVPIYYSKTSKKQQISNFKLSEGEDYIKKDEKSKNSFIIKNQNIELDIELEKKIFDKKKLYVKEKRHNSTVLIKTKNEIKKKEDSFLNCLDNEHFLYNQDINNYSTPESKFPNLTLQKINYNNLDIHNRYSTFVETLSNDYEDLSECFDCDSFTLKNIKKNCSYDCTENYNNYNYETKNLNIKSDNEEIKNRNNEINHFLTETNDNDENDFFNNGNSFLDLPSIKKKNINSKKKHLSKVITDELNKIENKKTKFLNLNKKEKIFLNMLKSLLKKILCHNNKKFVYFNTKKKKELTIDILKTLEEKLNFFLVSIINNLKDYETSRYDLDKFKVCLKNVLFYLNHLNFEDSFEVKKKN